MQYLIRAETRSLICLFRARSFPYLSAKRQRQIQMYPVLARDPFLPETVSVLGLSEHNAERCFGLKTYTEMHGTMSEYLILDQNRTSFDDWDVWVPANVVFPRRHCVYITSRS